MPRRSVDADAAARAKLEPDSSAPSASAADTDGPSPDRIGVPDGGRRAWLVVVGAFIDYTIVLGLLNAFSIFQARYENTWPDMSTARVTWIGSTQVFVFFASGLLVGPAFDRYGARLPMLLGTACCLVSSICTAVSTHFWHFVVSQGFVFGLGCSLLYYPIIGALSEWFNKRCALALGIASSGAAIGGIFWPYVIESLFLDLSDKAVHRIIAAATTPPLLLSCLLVRERKDVAGYDRAGNRTLPSQTTAFKAVFERRFLALGACIMVLYFGLLIPFYYIPLYAQHHNVNEPMASDLLSITFGASVLGRIGTGWLADCFGRFNMLSLLGILVTIMALAWIWMTSQTAMIAFAVLYGFFEGGLAPLSSACVAQTTADMGHIGLRIGVVMLISSAGALSGGPLSGLVKDGPTGWVGVLCLASGMTLVGTLLLFGVRLWHRPKLLAKF